MTVYVYASELYHHGIKGQRWGERRYQYEDGTLTPEGRERYGYSVRREMAKGAYQAAKERYKRDAKTGWVAGHDYAERSKRANKSELEMIKRKAEYNAAKRRDASRAERAEFNTYRREMQKSGLPGSIKDAEKSERSTRLYNELVRTKGREYANAVEEKVKTRAIAAAAASGALLVADYAYLIWYSKNSN